MTVALLADPGPELMTLMPWVRFDDQYPIHRKVAGLSDAAFRLHSAAIFWCARNGTDGFVPEEDLDLVCAQVREPARFAAECVKRGTWHMAAHACASESCPGPREGAGWVIHDYLEYQPTKEEAEAADRKAREGKSDGGKLGNHRRWHAARGITDPGCPWCAPPSDDRSDKRSDTDRISESLFIAPSRPDRDGSVVSHLTRRNARGPDDDDDVFASQVIDAIYAATGEDVTRTQALKVAGRIIAAAKRPVGDRLAYVLAAIAAEAAAGGARARFLPPKPSLPQFASRPEWCADPCCDRMTRRREDPETGLDAGPCPKCSPALPGQEAS